MLAPTQLSIAAITGPSITLSWTDNATNETGYQVQMCTGANCTSFAAVSASTLAASSTTHTEAGLADGTVYRFRIRAVATSANSNWLTSGNLTTPGVPNAPAGLTTSTGRTGVTLSWSAVTGATSYDVQSCTASACTFATVTGSPVAAPTTTLDITNLTANTGYQFRVRANNAVGAGAYTTTSTVTTLNAMTAAVTSASVASKTTSSINLSWSGGATGSVGYLLELCNANCVTCNSPITVAQANPATTTYSFTGLTASTAYCFRITSFQGPDTDDRNAHYQYGDVVTHTAPNPPTGFSVTSTAATTAVLSWTDPAANLPTQFQIDTIASTTCSSFSGATTTTDAFVGAGAANTATITGLTPNTAYCFRIRSEAAGPYYSSYVTTAATPSTTTQSVPTAPSELVISSVSSTAIELRWQDRSSDETNWEVQRCDATSSTASCTTFTAISANGCAAASINSANVTRCLDTDGITAGEYYYYRVRAKNGAVDRFSDWVTTVVPVAPLADVASIGTDGTVYAMARDGDTVYIGGDFDYAGPVTGPLVRMTAGTSTVLFGNITFKHTGSTTTPSIHAVISDGAGGYYVGGEFTLAGTQSVQNLVHILSDGSVDTNWSAGLGGTNAGGIVYALARVGNYLVVGGNFTTLGGQARTNLGSLYVGGSAPAVDANWNPNPNQPVRALAAYGSGVYFAGEFTTISTPALARVRIAYASAVFGADASEYITSFCSGLAGADGTINALGLYGTRVVLGGLFSTLNGSSRSFLGEVDSSCAVTTWNPSVTGTDVKALAVSGTTLYVGGNFTAVNATSRTDFAAVNLGVTSGYVQTLNPAPNGDVYGIFVYGSSIYVVGDFTQFGGSTRYRAAAISSSGTLQTWAPYFNGRGLSVLVDANNIFVGGTFTLGGASARSNLAAYSASEGSLSTFAPNPDNIVRALHVATGRVFVGGQFTTISSTSRNYFASITSAGVLDTTAPTTNGFVYAIETVGGNLYMGGNFTQVTLSSTTSTRTRLAAFSLSGWTLQSWNPTANASVLALEAMEDLSTPMMLVGGAFTSAGGATENFLVKIDTSTGSAVGAFNPTITGSAVRAIVYNPVPATDVVYIGGTFTDGGGGEANFQVLNATSGAATASTVSADSDVWTMALDQTHERLYVGGAFTSLGGQAYAGIGKVRTDTDAIIALGTGAGQFNAGATASSDTHAIGLNIGAIETGTTVRMGGDFTHVNIGTEMAPAPSTAGVTSVGLSL